MLNTLARAADEMPVTCHTASTDQSSSQPLDRQTFLGLFKDAARTLDPDPYVGISILEQGMDQLLIPEDPFGFELGDQIIHARIDQPRRDLVDRYDPLQSGLVSAPEIKDLLDV
jgi:hypothetical protein